MPETSKVPEPETIIELVETIPTTYIVAALVAGVVIGAVLLLLWDDAMRQRTESETGDA